MQKFNFKSAHKHLIKISVEREMGELKKNQLNKAIDRFRSSKIKQAFHTLSWIPADHSRSKVTT